MGLKTGGGSYYGYGINSLLGGVVFSGRHAWPQQLATEWRPCLRDHRGGASRRAFVPTGQGGQKKVTLKEAVVHKAAASSFEITGTGIRKRGGGTGTGTIYESRTYANRTSPRFLMRYYSHHTKKSHK